MRLATALQGAKKCRMYWRFRPWCKQSLRWFQRWLPRQVVRKYRPTPAFDEAAPNNRLTGRAWSVRHCPRDLQSLRGLVDAGARMSSLVQRDVLKVILSRTGGKKKGKRDLPCPPCAKWTRPSPSSGTTSNPRGRRHVHCPSSRGAMRRDQELVTEEVGGTNYRAKAGRNCKK